GGIVGNILTGVFAQRSVAALNGSEIAGGWLDGNWIQVVYQLLDSAAGFASSFVVTYAILFAMNKVPGLRLRATAEDEELGMDAACIGELAYWHALNDASKAAAAEIARNSFGNAVLSAAANPASPTFQPVRFRDVAGQAATTSDSTIREKLELEEKV
ncbi:MAG: ammonium transporter family-domain-containing protein, partial [Olpidium bornovanus]